ncbi:uncharacterized protein TNCV_4419431 [Trichonephila clavipes]|nr:uncharacterized protein TNCV_4419431 [Trichonephila clavipes]
MDRVILTKKNCGGGDRGRVAIYRPFGEVSLSLNRTVTCMVLKANDRRTSCPCHDEFRSLPAENCHPLHIPAVSHWRHALILEKEAHDESPDVRARERKSSFLAWTDSKLFELYFEELQCLIKR